MNVPLPVIIGPTLQEPVIKLMLTILGLYGLESLKIRYDSKVKYIDNIQSHNFYRAGRDKSSFTLESEMICKPIQQELFMWT